MVVEGTAVDIGVINLKVLKYSATLSMSSFVILELSQEELDRLGHNISYTVQSFLKLDTLESRVRDWGKNFKIGVFNNAISENITVTESTDEETGDTIETVTDSTDYDNLTNDEIFDNAEYWSQKISTKNVFENVTVDFPYNKDYPLYILLTNDYDEGYPIVNTLAFTEPCIVETNLYKEKEAHGNFPIPITALIGDEDTAELTLAPHTQSTPIIVYDFPVGDDYSTKDDMAVKGLILTADIEYTDNMVIYATLKAPTGETGSRSIVVNQTEDNLDTITIGGKYDLWGFEIVDIQDFKAWEIQLTASNLDDDEDSTINFKNIQLTCYSDYVDAQDILCKIDSKNVNFYGLILQDVTIPEGLETDTQYLHVNGTDRHDSYLQTIDKKQIELKFMVDTCSLEESTSALRNLAKLLVNERDKYNRPIPRRIEFSHYPDVYFEYIMEEAINTEIEVSGYVLKAKLTIPNGTAYAKTETITNNIGNVTGLAKINPVITIKPTGANFELIEKISQQKFNMGYNDYEGKIIEINCEDREVLIMKDEEDLNPIDISAYVDFNADWFSLHGEYEFETTNCTLMQVAYTERW